MFLFGAGLILIGGFLAFYGQKLFRLLLPIAGLIVGAMVGFSGVQAVLGSGAVSLSIAVLVSVMVAVLMGLLSFVFYEVAVIVFCTILGASFFTFLGVAIGLEDNGFVLTLLGLAGGVIGFIYSNRSGLPASLIFSITSFWGVAMIMAAIMLFAGDVSLDQLHDDGVVRTVIQEVDQSFLWLFVWIAGSLIAMNIQIKLAMQEFMTDSFAFVEKK